MPEHTKKPRLSSRFQQALGHSFELHERKVRKGTGIPYVSHLLAVASLVLEYGGDEDEAIAALLHDAAEDQGGESTLIAIDARFGPRVSALVRELSDSIPSAEAERSKKAPWRERKEDYLARLATASRSARLVSAADKLHNCRAIVADLRRDGELLWIRFNASKQDQLWFYRAFYEATAHHGPTPITDALAEAVLDLEQAARPGDLAKAIAIAARAHLRQEDKGRAPYVLHPLRLMANARGNSTRIAAVLHDVVEDGDGWSLERLEREGFAKNVIDGVRGLTKVEGESYEDFIERTSKDPIARAVKLLDLEDNMDLRRLGDLRDKDVERLRRYHASWLKLRAVTAESGEGED